MGRLAFPALFMKHSARGGRGDAATQCRQTLKAPSGPPWAAGRAGKHREGAPGLDSMIHEHPFQLRTLQDSPGLGRGVPSQNRGRRGWQRGCWPRGDAAFPK